MFGLCKEIFINQYQQWISVWLNVCASISLLVCAYVSVYEQNACNGNYTITQCLLFCLFLYY